MFIKKTKYFRIIYLDNDNLTFNISEIITDDDEINEKTCKLQNSGRKVNVDATPPKKDINDVPSIEAILKIIPKGYKRDPDLFW